MLHRKIQRKPAQIWRLLALVLLAGSAGSASATWSVGAGSTVSLGDAQIDLGCGDLIAAGTLLAQDSAVTQIDNLVIPAAGGMNGGTAALQVTGDFAVDGTWSAGTGSVAIADGCGNTTSNILGANTFYDLLLVTTSGKTVAFESNSTTNVVGQFLAQGSAGNLLRIRSTVDGQMATLNTNPGAVVSYVDVQDNAATRDIGLAGADALNSIKGSNTPGWFIARAVEFAVPTLTTVGLVLMSFLLFAAAAAGAATRSHRRP